jgi:uncharacterized membrane protein
MLSFLPDAPLATMGGWWAAGFILSLLCWPALALLFASSFDRAYALARALAAPLVAYIVFVLSSAGVAPNALPTCLGAAAIIAIGSLLAIRRARLSRAVLRPAAYIEAVYILVFVLGCLMRSRNPDLDGLEKFMNFGFVNAIYFAAGMPPPDPWFAGASINYYYFGHFTAATMIRLTGVPLDVGYNLAFAHVFAAFAVAIASFAWQALAHMRLSGRAAVGFAAAAVLLATFGGNFHGILEGLVRPALAAAGLVAPRPYFFADSSRLVGFHPPTDDKAFVEFPGYSLIVGDLHAHVMALPLMGALYIVAFAIATSRTDPATALKRGGMNRALILGQAAFAALVLGLDGMTNLWDLPINFTLLSLATAVALLRSQRALQFFSWWLLSVAAIAAGVLIIMLPLWLWFRPFGDGVQFVQHATPWWQLFLLYGNYLLILLAIIAFRLCNNSFRRLPRAENWLLVLAGLALVLIAIPEIVHVSDIYGASGYARANTMFKTSYHVYVILPLVTAISTAGLFAQARLGPGTRAAVVAAFAALLLPALAYPWFGLSQLLGMEPPLLRLDGFRFMLERYPEDAAVRSFLATHRPQPGLTLLEASGASYSYGGRMSAMTGIPTVLGWHEHEYLWRRRSDEWEKRAAIVAGFYRSASDDDRRAVISYFNIRYVIIGEEERHAYGLVDESGLLRLGRIAFQSGRTMIVEVAP